MAVRSDISVDFSVSPRIITVASPSVALLIQDLNDTLRSIERGLAAGMQFSSLLLSAGKNDLGSGALVGITLTLQNAQVAFAARPGPATIQCAISGGNLVAVDATNVSMSPIAATAFTQVTLAQSSSATIINGAASTFWQYAIEGGLTGEQIMRLLLAVAAGNASGLEGAAPVFKDVANTKNRIAGTYSAGTRTVTTRDGT